MPTQEAEVTQTDEVAAEPAKPNRAARRAAAKNHRATLTALRAKKPREKEVSLQLAAPDEPVTFLFRALGAREWEQLIALHKPTGAQRADGQPFNTETFPPALLSAVCIDPELTEAEWAEIWNSPDWNRGEIADLYGEAVNLCSAGFDIPFNASA
jgi:hypothetical protein